MKKEIFIKYFFYISSLILRKEFRKIQANSGFLFMVIDNMSSEKISETGSVSGFEPPWYYAVEENNLKEGKLLHFTVGEKDVLLVRSEGQINALSNICPHARCPMDRGKLEDFVLTCLCHGRKFDIRTGQCLNDSLELKRYEWKLEGASIGVKIE